MAHTPLSQIKVFPLTPRRWADLERLFGPRGACEDCWCMWWRLRSSEFGRQTPLQRKRGLKRIVESGRRPGILAFLGKEPIAWCSVEPREHFAGLERSRLYRRVDDQPVWSISCFFIAKPFRRKGLMVQLLRAAVEFAGRNGARIVEGYPIEPGGAKLTGYAGFTGIVSAFRMAGFEEVARPDPMRRIMRYWITEGRRLSDRTAR